MNELMADINNTIPVLQGQVEQSSIPFHVCVCRSLKAVIALYPNKAASDKIAFKATYSK